MIKKIFITINLFLLTACSFGIFGIETTNLIFNNENHVTTKYKNEVIPKAMLVGISKIYSSNNKEELIWCEQKIDDINITLNTYEGSKIKVLSANILPIIPAIPIIPTFFFPAINHKEFCGGETLKVVLTFKSDNDIIINNIKIDLNNIYLLKDNQKIYANNFINKTKIYYNTAQKKNNYTNSFIIDFPIICEETNNSLIFVENIKINDRHINMPIGKFVYKSGFAFGIGYFVNN